MIKITKPGKTIRYKFICSECGCEYIADLADVMQLYCGAQKANTCNCPSCGAMNFGIEFKYKED
jgi:rubredoxin